MAASKNRRSQESATRHTPALCVNCPRASTACPRAMETKPAVAAHHPATVETEQVRARLDFDLQHTVAATPTSAAQQLPHATRPPFDAWPEQHVMRPPEQALTALEAEWEQKLQAPLDELADFELKLAQGIGQLQRFLTSST